jgi:predicted DCC family thiol-disulfide oxidoreductase YuxK
MDKPVVHCKESSSFIIVCDERCAVVKRLAALLKVWDRKQLFTFVDRESESQTARNLIADLDKSRWSLFLIDENKERWYGPEAIPMILKHLPSGRFAAVFYILPGTMWLTRQIYKMVSRTRLIISKQAPA